MPSERNPALKIKRTPSLKKWVEDYRIIGAQHAESGRYNTTRTPYLTEIMERLGTQDPTKKIVVMKTPQLGFTELSISWLFYIIDCTPANTYYVTSDKEEARRFGKIRFTAELANHEQVKQKIISHNNQATHGTQELKQFYGGSLSFVGTQTTTQLRGTPVKYIIIDEVDLLSTDIQGEGSPIQLLENRQTTFANSKMYLISTPTRHEETEDEGAYKSNIYMEFLKGDQRKYFVPCPFCSHFQILQFDNLQHEKQGNEIILKGYECSHCQKIIDEKYKHDMLLLGEWRATTTVSTSKITSYHLNALYTPTVWRSWMYCVELYYESINDKTKEINFYNNVLGIPYTKVEHGIHPVLLKGRRENYENNPANETAGKLPEGLLFLTAGVDIQKDRIECSLWGWGLYMESWLVEHYTITATNTANHNDSSYTRLHTLLCQEWRLHYDVIVGLEMAFIDMGYNPNAVLHFCSGIGRGCNPVRGVTTGNLSTRVERKYRVSRYDVNVNIFKSAFYAYLETEDDDNKGRVHFPLSQDDIEYYKQLVSEYQTVKKNKVVWEKRRDRNEALDCRVYAQAAAVAFHLQKWDETTAENYINSIK